MLPEYIIQNLLQYKQSPLGWSSNYNQKIINRLTFYILGHSDMIPYIMSGQFDEDIAIFAPSLNSPLYTHSNVHTNAVRILREHVRSKKINIHFINLNDLF